MTRVLLRRAVVKCTLVGNAQCVKCPAGRSKASIGNAETCKACEAGKYCAAGAIEPAACKPGSSSRDPTQKCSDCAKGTFAASKDATECIACVEGRFQDEEGRSDCKTCALCRPGRGEAAPCSATASRVCEDCRAGSYSSSQPHASPCTNCAPGKVSTTARSQNATDCKPCERPKVEGGLPGFADADNSTLCVGGDVRLVKEGFWRMPPLLPCNHNASDPPFVYECPVPGDCTGMTGDQELKLNEFLERHKNDWTLISDALALANSQSAACGDGRRQLASASLDGREIAVNVTDGTMIAEFVHLNETLEITLSGCAPGHKGPRCAVCDVDYARSGAAPGSADANSCIGCPEQDPFQARFIGASTIFVVLVYYTMRGMADGDGANAFDDVEEDDSADGAYRPPSLRPCLPASLPPSLPSTPPTNTLPSTYTPTKAFAETRCCMRCTLYAAVIRGSVVVVPWVAPSGALACQNRGRGRSR